MKFNLSIELRLKLFGAEIARKIITHLSVKTRFSDQIMLSFHSGNRLLGFTTEICQA